MNTPPVLVAGGVFQPYGENSQAKSHVKTTIRNREHEDAAVRRRCSMNGCDIGMATIRSRLYRAGTPEQDYPRGAILTWRSGGNGYENRTGSVLPHAHRQRPNTGGKGGVRGGMRMTEGF